MVFEEFIGSAQEPRIVLLEAEEVPVLGLQLGVDNREQLNSESPTVVARRLLAVCSASREVAKRFLERPGPVAQFPATYPALMGLGLSLHNDIFWLPDDLPRYVKVHSPNAVSAYSDERRIRSMMISFDAFEEMLHWAQKRWERWQDITETDHKLRHMMTSLLITYHGAQRLIVMVGIPRQHVSWHQIRIVKAVDGAPFDASDGHESARYNSAFDNYEAERRKWMETQSPCIPNYNSNRRPWPELYFAFPRRSSPDTTE